VEELHPRYNIAPSQPIPVLRSSGPRRVIASMPWGVFSGGFESSRASANGFYSYV
jgi:putative SOS response-associated peptidase YedK